MKLIALLMFCCFTITLKADEGAVLMRIYYTPFEVETYQPITKENIKEKAVHKIAVTSEATARKLLDLVVSEKISGEFNLGRVRLLIEESSGRKIFVDAAGCISVDQQVSALSKKDFKKLEKLLAEIIAK